MTPTDAEVTEAPAIERDEAYPASPERGAASLSPTGVSAEELARAAAQAAFDKKADDIVALDLTERMSGTNLLWVWCALLVVCTPLAWRAWRVERDYDLRVTREVAHFVESGELPTGDERPRGHRVLGFIGVVVVFLLVDALLDVFF